MEYQSKSDKKYVLFTLYFKFTNFTVKTSHPEPPEAILAEKRQNKAIYLTWTSITIKFVKKTSMPNFTNFLCKILRYNHKIFYFLLFYISFCISR